MEESREIILNVEKLMPSAMKILIEINLLIDELNKKVELLIESQEKPIEDAFWAIDARKCMKNLAIVSDYLNHTIAKKKTDLSKLGEEKRLLVMHSLSTPDKTILSYLQSVDELSDLLKNRAASMKVSPAHFKEEVLALLGQLQQKSKDAANHLNRAAELCEQYVSKAAPADNRVQETLKALSKKTLSSEIDLGQSPLAMQKGIKGKIYLKVKCSCLSQTRYTRLIESINNSEKERKSLTALASIAISKGISIETELRNIFVYALEYIIHNYPEYFLFKPGREISIHLEIILNLDHARGIACKADSNLLGLATGEKKSARISIKISAVYALQQIASGQYQDVSYALAGVLVHEMAHKGDVAGGVSSIQISRFWYAIEHMRSEGLARYSDFLLDPKKTDIGFIDNFIHRPIDSSQIVYADQTISRFKYSIGFYMCLVILCDTALSKRSIRIDPRKTGELFNLIRGEPEIYQIYLEVRNSILRMKTEEFLRRYIESAGRLAIPVIFNEDVFGHIGENT